MYYYSTIYDSPVGKLTLACNGANLTGLWIEGQKYYGGSVLEKTTEKNNIPVFNAVKKWLDGYFGGKKPQISELSLAPAGSSFRRGVLEILLSIPYGKTVTYGYIAEKMKAGTSGQSVCCRAVGGAVSRNPISIIIPCHRVVGANGNLTGYAGGMDIKIKLLELEGADMSGLFIPSKKTRFIIRL